MATSPFDYRAEQKGFEVLLSIKEIAEFVKIPINGLGTPQRKIDQEPDEVVRMLRALRNANLFLQNQREISGRTLEARTPIAERFYALYREQFNSDLTVPNSVVEEWISVGTSRAKEKITVKPQQVGDWTFADRARR